MYLWLWRHLPGDTRAKTAVAVVLALGVVALLLFVVFPWAEPRLLWDRNTVGS